MRRSFFCLFAAAAVCFSTIQPAQALRIEGEVSNPEALGWAVAWGDVQRDGPFRMGVIQPNSGSRFYMELDETTGALLSLGWFIRAEMHEMANPMDRSTMGPAYDINVFDMHFTPGADQLFYPDPNGADLMISNRPGGSAAPDAAIGYGYWAAEGTGAFGVPLLRQAADGRVPITGPFVDPNHQFAVLNTAEGYGYDPLNPGVLNPPITSGPYAGFAPYFWTYFFPGLDVRAGDVFLANTYSAAGFGAAPYGFLDYQLSLRVTSVSRNEVPEPASMLLLGSALLGIAARRRRLG